MKQAEAKALKLTATLGLQIEEALKLMVELFLEVNQHHSEQLLSQYSAAEITEELTTLLLRIVILFSAEDRGLLPIESSYYQKHYALSTLFSRLAQQHSARHSSSSGLAQLLKLSELIYDGCTHPELKLSPLGGELFKPSHTPMLSQAKLLVPDALFIEPLRMLRFLNGEQICYQELNVEQIGSLYEILLNLTLISTDRGLQLVKIQARKKSGTHYTPRLLCDFIVEQTLRPHVEHCSTPDELLKLRVCDPSMPWMASSILPNTSSS